MLLAPRPRIGSIPAERAAINFIVSCKVRLFFKISCTFQLLQMADVRFLPLIIISGIFKQIGSSSSYLKAVIAKYS
jgi:hypothetical protein